MRGIIAITSLTVAIIASIVGRQTGIVAFDFIAGVGFLTAIFLGLSMLPFWDRVGLRLPRIGPLFQRPGPGEKWDDVDGAPSRTVPSQSKRS